MRGWGGCNAMVLWAAHLVLRDDDDGGSADGDVGVLVGGGLQSPGHHQADVNT